MNKNLNKPDTSESDNCIYAYIHAVTRVQLSRTNSKNFNATLQTSHSEYHQAVIFASEKHQTWTTLALNRTAVKLSNITKKPSKC